MPSMGPGRCILGGESAYKGARAPILPLWTLDPSLRELGSVRLVPFTPDQLWLDGMACLDRL